jgi:hypothetical protein
MFAKIKFCNVKSHFPVQLQSEYNLKMFQASLKNIQKIMRPFLTGVMDFCEGSF